MGVGIKHATTVASGDIGTATVFNEAHTIEGISRATMSGDQTITTATDTKVQFDTETHDPDSVFDAVTNYRYAPATAGYYLVAASIMYNDLADTNYYYIRIYKTGAQYNEISLHAGGANDNSANITDIVYLGATDYIEIYTRHEKGANADVEADDSFFSVVPLRI